MLWAVSTSSLDSFEGQCVLSSVLCLGSPLGTLVLNLWPSLPSLFCYELSQAISCHFPSSLPSSFMWWAFRPETPKVSNRQLSSSPSSHWHGPTPTWKPRIEMCSAPVHSASCWAHLQHTADIHCRKKSTLSRNSHCRKCAAIVAASWSRGWVL